MVNQLQVTKEQIFSELRKCMDPEVPVNVVDLGLIYGVNVSDKNDVNIKMTMTTRGCPMHDTLVSDVKRYLNKINGVGSINVEIVWDPPLVNRKNESCCSRKTWIWETFSEISNRL